MAVNSFAEGVNTISQIFPDVSNDVWFYNAVAFNVQKGYFKGYGNGYFGPADNIQRQDFVVVLSKIAGADLSPYVGQNGGFADVPTDAYFSAAIAWAQKNYILSGYEDGRFGVGDPITREQACKIFYNYYNGYINELSVSSVLSKYSDGRNVSNWAKVAVAWAAENHIIGGNGTLNPTGNTNRAETAQIIMNMSDNTTVVAKLINSATKAAVDAKAGYDWERHCTVENIDVGSATSTLNKIIQGVDSSADLNSVVGGFLGRGDQKQTCPKGQTLDTMDVQKDDGTTGKLYHGSSYTLKATNLQAGDIQNLTVNGDTYEFTIPDSTNPDRNGNNALSRFTNDIVLQSEVDAEIKGYVSVVTVNSVTANYKNIKVKAVITDGKLQSLEYSYAADAEIQLKAIVSITGTGNLNANAKYSNFVY